MSQFAWCSEEEEDDEAKENKARVSFGAGDAQEICAAAHRMLAQLADPTITNLDSFKALVGRMPPAIIALEGFTQAFEDIQKMTKIPTAKNIKKALDKIIHMCTKQEAFLQMQQAPAGSAGMKGTTVDDDKKSDGENRQTLGDES